MVNGQWSMVNGQRYHVPANAEHSVKFAVETDDIEPWLAIEPVLDEES